MLGRGEFIRLLFAELNQPYTEVFETKIMKELYSEFDQFKKGHPYIFAMPVVKHHDYYVSQTPAICYYIAMKCDQGRLLPSDPIQAQSLMETLSDVVSEGHDAWHTPDPNGSYESQRDSCKEPIRIFVEKRLPRFLNFFENILENNLESAGQYCIGSKLTYVDLALFHWLDGVQFQLPKVWEGMIEITKLKEFYKHISERPRIAERLATRKEKYDGTGPIF